MRHGQVFMIKELWSKRLQVKHDLAKILLLGVICLPFFLGNSTVINFVPLQNIRNEHVRIKLNRMFCLIDFRHKNYFVLGHEKQRSKI